MAASTDDIIMVLTGGQSNTDPYLSIGGEPSVQPVQGILNNLFDNVSDEDATLGITDYRCVYIFNNNSTDSLFNFQLYVDDDYADGAEIALGILKQKELQKVQINGVVTGGSFDVTYGEEMETVDYDPDAAIWADNFITALNNLPNLTDINVVVSGTSSARIFNVYFDNDDDYRYHPLLSLDITDLTGTTSITKSVARTRTGSPINTEPVLLEADTTVPNNISFGTHDIDDPLLIGTLRGMEGFPLWIRRYIPAGTASKSNDGFKIKIIVGLVEV